MQGRFASLLAAAFLFPGHSVWASLVPEPPTPASFAQLPVEFEVNRGQHDPAVRYLARARGYQMYLTSDGAVLAFGGSKLAGEAERSTVQLRFVGANRTPELRAYEPSEHKTNYFVGDGPSDFRTDIPNYARVLYRQVYPGIDVSFYGKNGMVEYDLLLQPGADPGRIELDFAGANKLEVDAAGDLRIHTPAGVLVQHRPIVFQEQDGKRDAIASDYRVLDGSRVQLQLAAYDRTRPLTIDPVLSYSTYIGGSDADSVYGVAVDASGNAYITGESISTNWPTAGAYQNNRLGTSDAVIAKLNPQGTGLVYSTYIGGRKSSSQGRAITLDASGNAYIVGYTSSNVYPTTSGAFSGPITGGGVFVTKLNPAGNALIFSTYLQNAGGTLPAGIRVDSGGNVVVGGQTTGSITTTAGVIQATNPSATQPIGFVTKLNPAGSALVFSTYLGGSSADGIKGLALDSSNNIYVTGYTSSSDFPTTTGAFLTTIKGGMDAFVAKINPAGTSLLYSTYLGGTVNDSGNAIAVDASGRAFVTGDTYSTDFPRVNGLPKAMNSTSYNVAFITAMSADGASIRWSTLFGGKACLTSGVTSCTPSNPTDGGTAIASDSSGTNLYVAGYLSSIDVSGFADPVQSRLNGTKDAFLAHLRTYPSNPDYYATRYVTRLGGSGAEQATGLALDPQGNAYVVGTGDSADFPTSKGSFRVATAGGQEGFLAKFSTLSAPVTMTGGFGGACGAGTAGATVSLTAFTALNATGDMVFTNGATTLASVPIVNGLATWSGPMPVGVHKFIATRASDGATSQPFLCRFNQ